MWVDSIISSSFSSFSLADTLMVRTGETKPLHLTESIFFLSISDRNDGSNVIGEVLVETFLLGVDLADVREDEV